MTPAERQIFLALPLIQSSTVDQLTRADAEKFINVERLSSDQQLAILRRIMLPQKENQKSAAGREKIPPLGVDVPEELRPYLSLVKKDGFAIGFRFGDHLNLLEEFDTLLSPSDVQQFMGTCCLTDLQCCATSR